MDPSNGPSWPASEPPTPLSVPPPPDTVAHSSVQPQKSGANISRRKRQASLRNITAPVNSLPNELFIEIFLLAEPRPIGNGGETRIILPDTASWAPLMLVCRHWRDVILSTPRLWRVIKVRESLKWAELAVSRSQNATLGITFWGKTSVTASLPILWPVAERIVALNFHDTDKGQLAAALELVSSAHSLVKLYLKRNYQEQDGGVFPDVLLHSVSIDHQRFPAMTALTIQGVRMVLKDPQAFFSRLRFLDLKNCVLLCDPPVFTLSTFLDMLANCTALERASLYRVLSQFHHGQPQYQPVKPVQRSRIVSIPTLRKLIIEDEAEVVSSFMSLLNVDPNVDVHLVHEVDTLSNDSPGVFVPLLPPNQHQTLPDLDKVRSLNVIFDVACGSSEVYCWSGAGGGLSLSLRLKQDAHQRQSMPVPRAVDEIIQLFANAPLTKLSVYAAIDLQTIEEAEWARLFPAFRALECLALGGVSIDVPKAFAALAGPQPGENGGRVVCPRLRTLSVHGPYWSDATQDCILRCLVTRARGGATTLEELQLEPCFESCKEFGEAKSSFLREIGAVFAGEVAFGYDLIEELDAIVEPAHSGSDSDSNSDSDSD
ncbi:hypothetical protein V8D89_000532 [Ganoderma adspersum]